MAVVGVAAAVLAAVVGPPQWAPSIGWACACLVYVLGAGPLLRADGARTKQIAAREDPRRTVSDLLLVFAATASVVAVIVVLATAGKLQGAEKDLGAGLGVISVGLSWFLVQTLFMLRYAELYYSAAPGGIDFNSPDELPSFVDFAYFAVTVGMTFQVSDTSIRSGRIRAATLRHALISYFFGTFVIASVVNLVAGLA